MNQYNPDQRPFKLPTNIGDNFIDSAICSSPLQKSKSDKKIIRKVRSFTDCLFPQQCPKSIKMMSYSNQLSSVPSYETGTQDSPGIKQKQNYINPFLQAKLQNLNKSPSKNSPVKSGLMGETRNTIQEGNQFVRFREVRERPLNIGGGLLKNGQI